MNGRRIGQPGGDDVKRVIRVVTLPMLLDPLCWCWCMLTGDIINGVCARVNACHVVMVCWRESSCDELVLCDGFQRGFKILMDIRNT